MPKYVLDTDALSEPALSTFERTLQLSRNSHYTDVVLRVNGEDVRKEADWIKYLELVE